MAVKRLLGGGQGELVCDRELVFHLIICTEIKVVNNCKTTLMSLSVMHNFFDSSMGIF